MMIVQELSTLLVPSAFRADVLARFTRRRSAPALLLPHRLVMSAGMLQRVVPERRLECLPARFGHIGSHRLQRPS